MRNVLLFLVFGLFLTACEKKYCWNCELRTTTLIVSNNYDTSLVTKTHDEAVCDKTERQIGILQDKRTEETVEEYQGVKTYKMYVYSCQKE